MGYQRINFKDQNVERPKTFEFSNNSDGSTTLIDSFGNVEELGTPINAENMNHIEEGILAGSFTKFDIDAVCQKDELVTDIQEGKLKIYKSLIDNNFGHFPTEKAYWEEVSINSGGDLETNITNCITKKPQKFNLELADGVLTLKSGSIVTVANGFEADETTPKFDEKVVSADVSSSSASASTKVLISYSSSSNVLIALPLANSTAGAGVTAKSGLAFNTTTNKISSYNSSGSLQYVDCCLPLAIVSTDSSGKYATIDQVFDGIGYIGTAGTTGSTIWLAKDVTLIIPNGRNEDGTLKNIVFTTTRTLLRNGVKGETRRSVSFYSTNAIGIGTGFMSARTYADRDSTFGYQYVEDLNKTFVTTRDYAEPLCIIADITCNANAVTFFRPKNVFRALDWNDFAALQSLTKAYITETYVSGGSWYRVYSDGWCEQGGFQSRGSGSNTQTVQLLKTYANTNYSVVLTTVASSAYQYTPNLASKATGSFGVFGNGAYTQFVWRASGYIA